LINELRALDVDSKIDPIFKLDLIHRLLQIGVQGSEPLRAGFDDLKAELDASDFPWDANWMSPGDSDPRVSEARVEAKSLLQNVQDWDERVKRMGASFRIFRDPRPTPPKWIGWVAREQDRYVAMLPPQHADGELFVLAPDPTTGRTSLVNLGRDTEIARKNIVDLAAQVVGAPVCVFPAPQSTARRSATSTPTDAF